MSKVRVVSFAAEGIPCPKSRFTFFYRRNTGKKWLSRGLNDTSNLTEILTEDLNKVCEDSPTRTILRTDDGSGAEVTIEEMVQFIEERMVQLIEEETVLSGRKSKTPRSINLVVYPENPIDANEEKIEKKIAAIEEIDQKIAAIEEMNHGSKMIAGEQGKKTNSPIVVDEEKKPNNPIVEIEGKRAKHIPMVVDYGRKFDEPIAVNEGKKPNGSKVTIEREKTSCCALQ